MKLLNSDENDKNYLKGSHQELFLTHASFEEFAAYSLIHTDRLCNLLHVSAGGFTQSADAVDAADSLSQESIGCLQK